MSTPASATFIDASGSREKARLIDVLARIKQLVAAAPDALAIAHGGQHISYAQLDRMSDRLARQLMRHGVVAGDRVAVYMERSAQAVIALLGVLKLGGVYAPVDPALPGCEVTRRIDAARIKAVLTVRAYAARLDAVAADVHVMDDLAPVPQDAPLPVSLPGDAAAYLIFTSGTTGRPKPVMVSRDSLAFHAATTRDLFELSPSDRVLQFCAPGFDVSIEEMVPSLCAGATLVFVDDIRRQDIASLTESLATAQVTLVNLPTSVWAAWCFHLAQAGRKVPTAIRVVAIGSEACPPGALEVWGRVRHARCDAWNCYGLTETTITNFAWPIEPAYASNGTEQSVPIGRPLAGTLALIVRDGQPAASGQAGELLIGGPGVALGYLDQPDATDLKFVPFDVPGHGLTRMAKTGDLAEQLPCGDVVLRGRIDRQVKIRGYRVELARIESALSAVPNVQAAAVKLKSNRLLAYLVLDDAANCQMGHFYRSGPSPLAAIFEHAQQALSDYERPHAMTVLASFPLTINGKLDYAALPEPVQTVTREPLLDTPFGHAVVDVLGFAPDLDLNFFEAGGDSVSAMRLCSVWVQHGHRVAVAELGARPLRRLLHDAIAIAGAAIEQEAPSTDGKTDAFVAGLPLTKSHLLKLRACKTLWERAQFIRPLLPMQQQMIAQSTAAPREGFCIEQVEGRLQKLDVELFRAAWQCVAERHEALRTYFYFYFPDMPLQVVAKTAQLDWEVRSGQGVDIDQWLIDDRRRGFDYGDQIPHRLRVFDMGDQAHFVWTYHHALLDGWSDTMLLSDAFDAYRALQQGRDIEAREVGQYRAFVQHQISAPTDTARAFWQAQLNSMPADRHWFIGAQEATYEYDNVAWTTLECSASMSAGLAHACRRLGVTVGSVATSLFGQCICRQTSSAQATIGSVVTTRPAQLSNIERSAGLYLNVIPVTVTRSPGSDSGRGDWLKEQFHAQAAGNEHAWFDVLALANDALFDCAVIVQNFPEPDDAQVGELTNHPQSGIPVNLYVWPERRLRLALQYNRDYISADVAQSLLAALQSQFSELVAEAGGQARLK